MKILIVVSKYHPAVGGLELAVRNIAAKFKKSGHDVRILTNRYSRKLPANEIIDGISVRRYFFTDRMPRSKNPWIWFKYLIRLLIAPLSLAKLTGKIKNFTPDIVHLHFVGSPALYLLALHYFMPFKYIVSIHGSDVELFPYKSEYQKWLLIKTFEKANFVTANSSHLLHEAIAMTGKDIHFKSKVVPMAFPYEDYDKAVEPFKHSRPYLFAAGRFIYKKGFDVLIEAFGKLVQNQGYRGDLILAGNGEERENYQWLCKKWGIEKKVNFFGYADRVQMAALMKGCEMFVMPSRLEAFGIVLLEALYAGKRTVASNTGGLAELMEENADFLVPPDNAELLVKKIEWALSNPACWKPISPEGLKQKYSWSNITDNYLSIYKKILS